MRNEVCCAVKEIYQAMDAEEAKNRLRRILDRFDGKADRFCE